MPISSASSSSPPLGYPADRLRWDPDRDQEVRLLDHWHPVVLSSLEVAGQLRRVRDDECARLLGQAREHITACPAGEHQLGETVERDAPDRGRKLAGDCNGLAGPRVI